jgi:hypothetical protein
LGFDSGFDSGFYSGFDSGFYSGFDSGFDSGKSRSKDLPSAKICPNNVLKGQANIIFFFYLCRVTPMIFFSSLIEKIYQTSLATQRMTQDGIIDYEK